MYEKTAQHQLATFLSGEEEWYQIPHEDRDTANYILDVFDWLSRMTLLSGYLMRMVEEEGNNEFCPYVTRLQFPPVEVSFFSLVGRINAHMTFPDLWNAAGTIFHPDPRKLILERGQSPRREITAEHIGILKFFCECIFAEVTWDQSGLYDHARLPEASGETPHDQLAAFLSGQEWSEAGHEYVDWADYIVDVFGWLSRMTLLGGYFMREVELEGDREVRWHMAQLRFPPVEVRFFKQQGRLNARMDFPGLGNRPERRFHPDARRLILERGQSPRRKVTRKHIEILKFLCGRFFPEITWIDEERRTYHDS